MCQWMYVLAGLMAGLATAGAGQTIEDEQMNAPAPTAIIDRLQPAQPDSGLRMDGYFIWGSSVIRVGDQYHMFSSRWPREDEDNRGPLLILNDYIDQSEIVYSVSDTPEGPYRFKGVALRARGEGHWDFRCAHNPCIAQVGNELVLFYLTVGEGEKPRRLLACATAANIDGPWVIHDAPLAIPDDWACNPAVWIHDDGRAVLAYRRHGMRIAVVTAADYRGPYSFVNDETMPGVALEDPFLFYTMGQYHMILEDNEGRLSGSRKNGIHLVSRDAREWQVFDAAPVVYGDTISWTDGTRTTVERRERPWLLIEDGVPTYLITATMVDRRTRSVVQPISRDWTAAFSPASGSEGE